MKTVNSPEIKNAPDYCWTRKSSESAVAASS